MDKLGRISGISYFSEYAINSTQHPIHDYAQTAPTNGLNDDVDAPSPAEQIADFNSGVKEKAAKLIELAEQITNGRFVGANLTKNLQEQAEGLSAALDVLWGHITSAASGSVWGSQESTDSNLSFGPEFGLDQIMDIEKKISEANAHSELAIFSLARIREAAMKALRCQENIEPEKALFLLQDDIT